MTQEIYNKNIGQRGFTLVETLLYFSIFTILIGSFVAYGIAMSAMHSKIIVMQEVQSNNRYILNIISQRLRAAAKVAAPVSGSNSGTKLEITEKSEGISTSTFLLDNGDLKLTDEYSPLVIKEYILNSSRVEISDLVFSNLSKTGDKDSIAVTLTTKYKNNASKEFDYEESVKMAINLHR